MPIKEPHPGEGHGSGKSRLAAGLPGIVTHRGASQHHSLFRDLGYVPEGAPEGTPMTVADWAAPLLAIYGAGPDRRLALARLRRLGLLTPSSRYPRAIGRRGRVLIRRRRRRRARTGRRGPRHALSRGSGPDDNEPGPPAPQRDFGARSESSTQ